mgnify:CR=1 FL=1
MGKSDIWKYFVKKSGGASECVYCKTIIKTAGTTSSMWKHIRYRHPTVRIQAEHRTPSLEDEAVAVDEPGTSR